MVRPREFDEDKALHAAMELFWEKGYEATSLTELTSRMGIQRPSIYSAFGDKMELFEAALRKYNQFHSSFVRTRLQSISSTKKRFAPSLRDCSGSIQGRTQPGMFCLNVMVELAPHDAKFEVLTREHQMYLAALFEETIERGKRSGELGKDVNSKVLAQTLVVSMIGLTVLMKSRPDRTFADNAVATILDLLK